jgi:hypothetical protein
MGLMKRLYGMSKAQRASFLGAQGGFGITVEWKHQFFDRDAVRDPVLDESRAALARLGSYTRRVARNAIKVKGAARKAPKPGTKAYDKWVEEQQVKPRSAPGSAPFQHTTNAKLYPRNIWFARDGLDSVIIGMAAFNARAVPIPAAIEFGEKKAQRNPRRRLRKVGGAGEIRIDGKYSRTNKITNSPIRASVAVTYAKLKTQAQADRANQLNEYLYGKDSYQIETAERPVIGPALAAASLKFDAAFVGRLSG